jgi:hypothetical protein
MRVGSFALPPRPYVEVVYDYDWRYRFYGRGVWFVRFLRSPWRRVNGVVVPAEVLHRAVEECGA